MDTVTYKRDQLSIFAKDLSPAQQRLLIEVERTGTTSRRVARPTRDALIRERIIERSVTNQLVLTDLGEQVARYLVEREDQQSVPVEQADETPEQEIVEKQAALKLPAVGQFVRITRSGGFNGRCLVHGSITWAQHTGLLKACQRTGCDEELSWSPCPDVTVTGWVRSITEATNGTPLISLTASKRSRSTRQVVSWSIVTDVQS